jgi:hypothetical protein
MKRSRVALTLCAVVVVTGVAACGPILQKAGPPVERRHATIAPSQFRTIGAIAGGTTPSELRISATVRQQVTDSGGVTVVRSAGRWESANDAIRSVCDRQNTPPLDGVLFIYTDRLELYDCVTQLSAFEVSGGSDGIPGLTQRLIAYLKGL